LFGALVVSVSVLDFFRDFAAVILATAGARVACFLPRHLLPLVALA
jgi:hypothetical protein